jgi:tripeptide aminopeptidase
MTPNEQLALDDLLELIPIPGPPGSESLVAAHLRKKLVTMGIPEGSITTDNAQDQSEYGGDTGNLIVTLDGHGRGDRWIFSTHMDTVPGAVGTEPKVSGNVIESGVEGKALGGDNRAGCALLLQVARALVTLKNSHRPVTLIFFVQEEVGLIGARGMDLKKLGKPVPALCFNFDGGPPDEIVTSVIGTERFNIQVEGIASHAGSRPEQGVSAATVASLAIAELEGDGWNGRMQRPEGEGSANIGTIEGGTGTNVTMPALHILAEARSHSPAFRRTIIDTWKAAFERVCAAATNEAGDHGQVTFSPGPTYESFALSENAPVVEAVQKAAQHVGVRTRCVVNNGGMDSNWIVAHGIPSVTLGVGQSNAHTPEERLDLKRFWSACEIATRLTEV